MYRIEANLTRRELPDFQDWLDENVPGWLHDTNSMGWSAQQDRRMAWASFRHVDPDMTSPHYLSPNEAPMMRAVLIPEDDKLAVLATLRWNAKITGVRLRRVLP